MHLRFGNVARGGLRWSDREAFRDDVNWQQRAITILVLQRGEGSVEARLDSWVAQHVSMIQRWCVMLVEIRSASGTDYAMYAVANRELLDLALSGQAPATAAAPAKAELEPTV